MKIYKALVINNRDIFSAGRLEVVCPDVSIDSFWVDCATPFGGHGYGFFNPVHTGASVLIAEIDNSDDAGFYWFANTWEPTNPLPKDSTRWEHDGAYGIPDALDTYRDIFYPQKYTWKTPEAHFIQMSDVNRQDPTGIPIQETYIRAQTNDGKYILLDAGQGEGFDRIVISDQKNNYIKIQTGDDNASGPEGIEAECKGKILITTREGTLTLQVQPSSKGDLKIINDGAGDITVDSKNGNVNVNAAKAISLFAEDINIEASNEVVIKGEKIHLN